MAYERDNKPTVSACIHLAAELLDAVSESDLRPVVKRRVYKMTADITMLMSLEAHERFDIPGRPKPAKVLDNGIVAPNEAQLLFPPEALAE